MQPIKVRLPNFLYEEIHFHMRGEGEGESVLPLYKRGWQIHLTKSENVFIAREGKRQRVVDEGQTAHGRMRATWGQGWTFSIQRAKSNSTQPEISVIIRG